MLVFSIFIIFFQFWFWNILIGGGGGDRCLDCPDFYRSPWKMTNPSWNSVPAVWSHSQVFFSLTRSGNSLHSGPLLFLHGALSDKLGYETSFQVHKGSQRSIIELWDIRKVRDVFFFFKRRDIIHSYLLTLYPNTVKTNNGNTVTETFAHMTSVGL
jgi:hypothetical protein